MNAIETPKGVKLISQRGEFVLVERNGKRGYLSYTGHIHYISQPSTKKEP
jgi:hypothetical protein